MARRKTYNDDPALIHVPLSVEEAVAIAEDPRQIKGREHVTHMAWRAAAAAHQLRQVRIEFDNELRRRTAAMPRPGLQPTLSPEQSARFLSPEQLTKLFDKFSRERLEAIEAIKARAAAELELHQQLTAELRAVAEQISNTPGIDPAVVARLSAALSRADHREGTR